MSNEVQRNIVLSQYPIIDRVREEVVEIFGEETEFRFISTLVVDGYSDLISRLRDKEYDRVVVLIPDQTVEPLMDILKVLGAVVRAKHRSVMVSGSYRRDFGRLQAIGALGRVSGIALLRFFMVLSFYCRVTILARAKRIPTAGSDGEVLANLAYLRTNLWLGVQAGGAMTHMRGVLKAAISAGSNVLHLSADKVGVEDISEIQQVQVLPGSPYVVPRELNHFAYHSQFKRQALEELKSFRGLLYQRTSIGNFAGVECSRKLRLPLVVEYNGSENWMSRYWGTPYLFSKCVEMAEWASLRHAHLVVTVSQALKNELIERGIPAEKILFQPNGVDPSEFDIRRMDAASLRDTRRDIDLPTDAIVVTFVGTFGPWHGVELLCEAARRIVDDVSEGSPVYFVFVGDGVRSEAVKLAAADPELRGRVIHTGLVSSDRIPALLAASDILVSPTMPNPDESEFFGSPTKLFEYMAAEKPVVASDVGQISEILSGSPVVNGHEDPDLTAHPDACGLLHKAGDVDALVRAIRYLSRNPDARRDLGVRARIRVSETYTWDQHVAAIYAGVRAVKVRVLVNALHSKSGGGVTYLRNMLPRLSADPRLDVHVCLNRSQLELYEGYLDGVTVHELAIRETRYALVFDEQWALPRLSRRIGADVTFSPANYGPVVLSNHVILLRNALAVAFEEWRLSKMFYWMLLYVGTAVSYLGAKRVVSVSEYARRLPGIGVFESLASEAEIVPHGVSSLYEEGEFEARTKTTLLAVSDIYVQKNLHNLIEALPAIRDKNPGVKLEVAGRAIDSGYMKRLRDQITRYDLEDTVEFLGNLQSDELKARYQTCTLFAFPSTVETFGNPLVEAMACGCPIACSNTAAMPDVAGDAAVYFEPRDPEGIAETINSLLADEDKRRRLSQRAVGRATMYSWERTAKKTADVLVDAAIQA